MTHSLWRIRDHPFDPSVKLIFRNVLSERHVWLVIQKKWKSFMKRIKISSFMSIVLDGMAFTTPVLPGKLRKVSMFIRLNSRNLRTKELLRFRRLRNFIKPVEAMLTWNFDINAVTNENETPILLASRNGHKELTSVLLENGADPLISTKEKFKKIPKFLVIKFSSKILQNLSKFIKIWFFHRANLIPWPKQRKRTVRRLLNFCKMQSTVLFQVRVRQRVVRKTNPFSPVDQLLPNSKVRTRY